MLIIFMIYAGIAGIMYATVDSLIFELNLINRKDERKQIDEDERKCMCWTAAILWPFAINVVIRLKKDIDYIQMWR